MRSKHEMTIVLDHSLASWLIREATKANRLPHQHVRQILQDVKAENPGNEESAAIFEQSASMQAKDAGR